MCRNILEIKLTIFFDSFSKVSRNVLTFTAHLACELIRKGGMEFLVVINAIYVRN